MEYPVELVIFHFMPMAQTRASGLTKLRAYISEQPHLRGSCRTDNVFLLRFLRAQKFNVDKSAALLEQYLLMREKHPLWFKNLGDVESDAVSELMDSGFVLFLPGTNCIKIDLPGKLILSKRKGLPEDLFS